MICDTSFLIDVLRGSDAAVAVLDEAIARHEPLWAPAPVVQELVYGAARHAKPRREAQRIGLVLDAVPAIPFTPEAARLAGREEARSMAAGDPLGRIDAQIAATALAAGEALVTRDKRFGRVAGLRVVSYTP